MSTTRTGLGLLVAGQMNAEVLVNESVELLSCLIAGCTIKDRTLTAAPGSPTAGDAYYINGTGSGAWLGFNNQFAQFCGNGVGWRFFAGWTGMMIVVQNEGTNGKLYVWKSGFTSLVFG